MHARSYISSNLSWRDRFSGSTGLPGVSRLLGAQSPASSRCVPPLSPSLVAEQIPLCSLGSGPRALGPSRRSLACQPEGNEAFPACGRASGSKSGLSHLILSHAREIFVPHARET